MCLTLRTCFGLCLLTRLLCILTYRKRQMIFSIPIQTIALMTHTQTSICAFFTHFKGSSGLFC